MNGLSIKTLQTDGVTITEVCGEPKAIRGMESVTALMDELDALGGASRVLAARELVDDSLFDLKSGFAGELAKQLTRRGMKLAVYGSLGLLEDLALKAFILEAKLGETVRFTKTRADALRWLAKG